MCLDSLRSNREISLQQETHDLLLTPDLLDRWSGHRPPASANQRERQPKGRVQGQRVQGCTQRSTLALGCVVRTAYDPLYASCIPRPKAKGNQRKCVSTKCDNATQVKVIFCFAIFFLWDCKLCETYEIFIILLNEYICQSLIFVSFNIGNFSMLDDYLK